MRDYGKIYCQFWWQDKVYNMTDKEVVLAVYLLTHPTGDMTGILRITPETISGDRKDWTLEDAKETLSKLFQKGFLTVKEGSSWVVINNFLKYNAPENPNQIKSIIKLMMKFPKNIDGIERPLSYLGDAVKTIANKDQKIKQQFNELQAGYEKARDDRLNPSETLSEPLGNPSETSSSRYSSNSNSSYSSNSFKDSCRADAQPDVDELTGELIPSNENTEAANRQSEPEQKKPSAILEIFKFWQTTMNHPTAKLDEKRRKLIRNAIKTGYPINDLKTAILGCSLTPHNVGDNDRGQRYDGLHVIFKDADQIDRFIHNAINRESMDANRETYQRGQHGQSTFTPLSGTPDEVWEQC
ncbi:hypothetical protein [Endozoicomonas sp.]|uniref:hypothetical protein n=1 Tax=Endozoicomonas sp. TaxID=1892382 RepID=UPI0028885B0A|nr:hypothetical protein [Endozoicomonas sp.]